jgi:hypothetical protein
VKLGQLVRAIEQRNRLAKMINRNRLVGVNFQESIQMANPDHIADERLEYAKPQAATSPVHFSIQRSQRAEHFARHRLDLAEVQEQSIVPVLHEAMKLPAQVAYPVVVHEIRRILDLDNRHPADHTSAQPRPPAGARRVDPDPGGPFAAASCVANHAD